MTTTRRTRLALGTAVAAVLVPLTLTGATAADDLDQTLDDLEVVEGEHVLSSGHVDLGPKLDDDGELRLLIHDDAARADGGATSVWRHPDETVLHVLDEAELTVPDDEAYAFLGVAPGAPVWVVPQTQHPDVVWLGWNTQDPEVMALLDRGATLTLRGVQGPGELVVYLQSGSFDPPDVLWDSRDAEPQPLWVDVNTHTHANWVFDAPGVYLVEVEVAGQLRDGAGVSDTAHLRFAVGTATPTAEALAATWERAGASAQPEDQDGPTAEPGAQAPDDMAQGGGPVVVGIAVLAVLLVLAVVVVVLRGRGARRRALGTPGAPGARDTEDEGR